MDSRLSALLELERAIANPAADVVMMLGEVPSIRDAMRALDGHPQVVAEMRNMFSADRHDVVELLDKSVELVQLRIEAGQFAADRLRDISANN